MTVVASDDTNLFHNKNTDHIWGDGFVTRWLETITYRGMSPVPSRAAIEVAMTCACGAIRIMQLERK